MSIDEIDYVMTFLTREKLLRFSGEMDGKSEIEDSMTFSASTRDYFD